jgi:hypothetical protein
LSKLILSLIALLALASLLLLAGCGSKSDEDRIINVIEIAFTKNDPKNCTERETQAFVEQMLRIESASAVRFCVQNAEAIEHDNDPVAVDDVEVDGSKATAKVAGRDAPNQTMVVALVKQQGDWMLDEIVAFPRLDRKAFIEETEKAFESGDLRPDPEVADCVLETYVGMSRRELEAMLYARSAKREIAILKACERGGV